MNDSLDLGGSGGAAFSFGAVGAQPGAFVVGKVLALAEVQARIFEGPRAGQPAEWDNGDPKMQYRVTLQTDLRDPANPTDQGVRDVYLDGRRRPFDNGTKSKLCAVLDAVRAVTGGTALAVGGHLRLHWVSGMGFAGDPRCYEAQYQAPALDLGGQLAPQAVPQGQPVSQPTLGMAQGAQGAQASWTGSPAPTFAQQQAQAYAQPVVQTEQGYVNTQTGEIAQQPVQQQAAPLPAGITAEAVAAVVAGGMDPHAVWPGVDLSAFGV